MRKAALPSVQTLADSPSSLLSRRKAAKYAGLIEIGWISLVVFGYFLVRGLIRGEEAAALAHGQAILALEARIGLSPEVPIQLFAMHQPVILWIANVMYLGGHIPVLIAVALWLYHRHRAGYNQFRTAFLLAAAMGLIIYALYPVAPPRYLPGFIDTLKISGIDLDGSTIVLFYNPYAAMPSLHVGWSLIAGVAVARNAHAWLLKIAGALFPVAMAITVLITGNHFLLDIMAGVLVALVSMLGAQLWEQRWTFRAGARSGAESDLAVRSAAVGEGDSIGDEPG